MLAAALPQEWHAERCLGRDDNGDVQVACPGDRVDLGGGQGLGVDVVAANVPEGTVDRVGATHGEPAPSSDLQHEPVGPMAAMLVQPPHLIVADVRAPLLDQRLVVFVVPTDPEKWKVVLAADPLAPHGETLAVRPSRGSAVCRPPPEVAELDHQMCTLERRASNRARDSCLVGV